MAQSGRIFAQFYRKSVILYHYILLYLILLQMGEPLTTRKSKAVIYKDSRFAKTEP